MEKYRGKTFPEWKEYIKKDKLVGIRHSKYIVVLEEEIARLRELLLTQEGIKHQLKEFWRHIDDNCIAINCNDEERDEVIHFFSNPKQIDKTDEEISPCPMCQGGGCNFCSGYGYYYGNL